MWSKQSLFIIIFLGFSFHLSIAQKPFSKTKKLATLGKLYGFLKYYHPEVAKGEYDWDQELIKQLPLVLKATDKESLSILFLNWINKLGVVEPCKKCDSDKSFFDKNFDLSWIQDESIFNSELTKALKNIENNRFQGDHFFAKNGPTGEIEILNEKKYSDFEYPNEEYRLLALFKYWNVIEYFYPYKYLTDQNWDSVLLEMIPQFQDANNLITYRNTIRELVAKLDDAHVFIRFNKDPVKYLPVRITSVENQPVVSEIFNDSLAKLNNLKLGDVIVKINDRDINEELEYNLKYVAGSNSNNKINKTYSYLLGGIAETVKLKINRIDKPIEITSNRYDFNVFNYWLTDAIKSKSLSDDIGYLKMASIKKASDISKIFQSFKNKKTIIIDLRKYPSPNYRAFSRFLNSEKRDFSRVFIPYLNYPGRFLYKKNLISNHSRKAFKGKVILLVNENTLSLAEFTAMAFQTADDVITVGNQTAGADGNGAYFNFLGEFRTSISGIGFHYPDGTESQRKGVKIDVEVKPTIKGLRQGRDEILEKAMQIASQED